MEYLQKAEGIRNRVFKSQYEDLRKSLLLNIGKKIVSAAIGVLMPYIPYNKQSEAKQRFLSAIEPLLSKEANPEEPEEIREIKEEHGQQTT